jgi:hypothetical protein
MLAAIFDRKSRRWRGAPHGSADNPGAGRVLTLASCPGVKPGSFCDPAAALENMHAAARALRAYSRKALP